MISVLNDIWVQLNAIAFDETTVTGVSDGFLSQLASIVIAFILGQGFVIVALSQNARSSLISDVFTDLRQIQDSWNADQSKRAALKLAAFKRLATTIDSAPRRIRYDLLDNVSFRLIRSRLKNFLDKHGDRINMTEELEKDWKRLVDGLRARACLTTWNYIWLLGITRGLNQLRTDTPNSELSFSKFLESSLSLEPTSDDEQNATFAEPKLPQNSDRVL